MMALLGHRPLPWPHPPLGVGLAWNWGWLGTLEGQGALRQAPRLRYARATAGSVTHDLRLRLALNNPLQVGTCAIHTYMFEIEYSSHS